MRQILYFIAAEVFEIHRQRAYGVSKPERFNSQLYTGKVRSPQILRTVTHPAFTQWDSG